MMDMDKLIRETTDKLDVIYQWLIENHTPNMTGEELHQLFIGVREWTNLRFGENMRAEVIRRYAREAVATRQETKPTYECMLDFEHDICYQVQCRYCSYTRGN